MDDQVKTQIQVWRERCRAGTMTAEDYKQAIATIRQGREIASATSAKSRATKASTKAKANINSDDLLGELEGL